MKLQLVNSQETFDAPRGIGLALIKTGAAIEVKERTYNVQPGDNRAVQWTLGGSDSVPLIKAFCPACKNGIQTQKLVPFKHCARTENAPYDLAEQFKQQLKKKPPVKQKASRSEEMAVRWLTQTF